MRGLAAVLYDRGYAPDFDQSDYDFDNTSGGVLTHGRSGA